jgi:starvation-inducible DNA-binding protein
MSSSAASRKARTSSTAGGLDPKGVADITTELRRLLADAFALYLKTKNFHWHMTGSHFRDYHLLLDEQADQLFAITDVIAELCADNQQLTRALRTTHEICAKHNDVATTSQIEVWIDEAERRSWFLIETLGSAG